MSRPHVEARGGVRNVAVDSSRAAPGVYFVAARGPGVSATRRVVVLDGR